MPVNSNKTYYVDQTVLGYLLGISDQKEAADAYTTYLEEVFAVMKAAVDSYLEESDMPDDQKQSIKKLFDQTVFNKDVDQQINQPPDFLAKQQIDNPELQKRMQIAIDAVNKGIYVQYQSKLTPEGKTKLNEYLKIMEDTIKLDMENTIQLVEMAEDYEKMKTQGGKPTGSDVSVTSEPKLEPQPSSIETPTVEIIAPTSNVVLEQKPEPTNLPDVNMQVPTSTPMVEPSLTQTPVATTKQSFEPDFKLNFEPTPAPVHSADTPLFADSDKSSIDQNSQQEKISNQNQAQTMTDAATTPITTPTSEQQIGQPAQTPINLTIT